MKTIYDVRRIGQGEWHSYGQAGNAFLDLRARLGKIKGPYQQRAGRNAEWGPKRNLDDTMERVREQFANHGPGVKISVRGMRDDAPRFAIRKVLNLEGPAIVRLALAQLGDEYTWGADGPASFDCSGFTSFCYEHAVGIYLPHSAYQQGHEAIDVLFHDVTKLKPGDLILYDASSRPAPNHVGIYGGELSVIDASSTQDQIVWRRYDANPVWGFGRITSVNGPL